MELLNASCSYKDVQIDHITISSLSSSCKVIWFNNSYIRVLTVILTIDSEMISYLKCCEFIEPLNRHTKDLNFWVTFLLNETISHCMNLGDIKKLILTLINYKKKTTVFVVLSFIILKWQTLKSYSTGIRKFVLAFWFCAFDFDGYVAAQLLTKFSLNPHEAYSKKQLHTCECNDAYDSTTISL